MSADPGVRLFVAQAGGPSARAVLVIHGGPDWDHSYLREPLDGLAGQCRLILPDLRGCGRSTRGLGDDQYTPGAATDDLAVLLDVLGVARADVPGFSYGGLLAQRLALTAPHRVRSLIIASSSILPVPPGAFAGWAERDRRVAAEAAAWSDPALTGPGLTVPRPSRARRRMCGGPMPCPATSPACSASGSRPNGHGHGERASCLRRTVMTRPGGWRASVSRTAAARPADMTFPAALAQQAAALIPPPGRDPRRCRAHDSHRPARAMGQAVSDFLG